MLRRILIILLAIFIVIQFIRPAKNITETAQQHDIAHIFTIPAGVQNTLKTSCYDCHSNHTDYKWYDEVQPLRWWIEEHIKEGKEHLNFSEFALYPPKKQKHKLEEIIEELEKSKMPLESYTFMHRDAILSDAQKQALMDWAKTTMNQIQLK